MAGLIIRDAVEADLPDIRRILVATWHATYDRLLGVERVTAITNDWHSLANLRPQIGRPGSAFLLALEDDRPVATSAASDDGGRITLRRLYVLPEAQGGGVGAALLTATLARFEGSEEATLEVDPRNEQAIRFYTRLGFTVAVPRPSCGGDDELSSLVMRRALKQGDRWVPRQSNPVQPTQNSR